MENQELDKRIFNFFKAQIEESLPRLCYHFVILEYKEKQVVKRIVEQMVKKGLLRKKIDEALKSKNAPGDHYTLYRFSNH